MKTPKTNKKTSAASRTEKKKEITTKTFASGPKSPIKEKQAPVSKAKTSLKKSVTDKTTATARKTEIKKPLSVKVTKAKQAGPKKEVGPKAKKSATKAKKTIEASTKAAQKTVKKPSSTLTEKKKTVVKKVAPSKPKAPEVKKAAKDKAPEKKSKKPLAKILKTVKTLIKKTAKAIKIGESVTPEKKQAKKSPAKIAPAKILKTAPKKEQAIKKSPATLKGEGKKKTSLKPGGKSVTPAATPRKAAQKSGPVLKSQEQMTVTSKKPAPTYAGPVQAEKKPNKNASLKIFLPEEGLSPEETYDSPALKLPEEYGENELLLMEVDPSIVFVSWEIKPEDISGETGRLTLRVYDVTAMDFDGSHAHRSFDIPLRSRMDSKFIDIKMSGRDVIMEIGLVHPDGTFKTIKRSNQVSMPELQDLEDFGISGPSAGADIYIGY